MCKSLIFQGNVDCVKILLEIGGDVDNKVNYNVFVFLIDYV